MEERISDEELTEFVRRTEEAADAWVRGDMDRYLDLIHHARGFTLLAPFGGPATQHDERAESVRASADYFRVARRDWNTSIRTPGGTPWCSR